MRQRRAGVAANLVVALIALAVVPVAALLLRAEYRVDRWSRLDPGAQYLGLLADAAPQAYSPQAARTVLLACDRALRGSTGAMQPRSSRAQVAQVCLTHAGTALRGVPTSGLAHLVEAEALIALGDGAGFNAGLVRSQANSAQEGWLAQRRLDLASSQAGDLDAAGLGALARDIETLMETLEGAGQVARAYDRAPAIRAIATTALNRLPGPEQARFLRDLKLLRASGG